MNKSSRTAVNRSLVSALIVTALLAPPVGAQEFSVLEGTTVTSDVPTQPVDTTVYGPGGLDTGQLIDTGGSLVEGLVSGGSLGSAAAGALGAVDDLIPGTVGDIASSITPLLTSVLSGSGLDLGSTLSAATPLLTDVLGGTTGEIIGQVGGILPDLLSGNLDAGSLISAGTDILGGLLSPDSAIGSVFSIGSSVLGGLLGGGGGAEQVGTGIELAEPLASVFSDPVTQTVQQLIFTGTSPSGTASAQESEAARVFAETGSILCLYNPSCITSNPTEYRSLYKASAGAMGIANPNEIRANIANLSRDGVKPDAYSSIYNSEQNTYYQGNNAELEITRARADVYLSKTGQEAQQKAIAAAEDTAKALNEMSDECDQQAKSSQDLIRCSMKLHTASTSFDAAQIALATNGQVDRNLANILLGNISRGVDMTHRAQDVERSAVSQRLFQDANLQIPVFRRR